MREFIDRTGLVGKLQILTNCNFESANSTVEALPKVTEQEIVKQYLEKIKKQIIEESEFAYANFEEYKDEVLGVESDELPDDDYRYGMERAVDIINEFLSEQEKEK